MRVPGSSVVAGRDIRASHTAQPKFPFEPHVSPDRDASKRRLLVPAPPGRPAPCRAAGSAYPQPDPGAPRFVQGAAAAVMMPSSMTLVGQAYPDPARRARAVAVWAMGGAIASSSGSLLGGLLSLATWRMIFFINVPAGTAALVLLARIAHSPHRTVPFDWAGQVTAVLAMGGLTYGAIQAGADGFAAHAV